MATVKLTGSCLCGAVSYEVEGEAQRFFHCHCQRCRKASGAGHGSLLLITPITSIAWIKGEALLGRYKVPEAERFYNCFCTRCGGPMPRTVPELDGVLVPAGSLDVDSPLPAQARIFWDSRAEWSCADELPAYPEYPPPVSDRRRVRVWRGCIHAAPRRLVSHSPAAALRRA